MSHGSEWRGCYLCDYEEMKVQNGSWCECYARFHGQVIEEVVVS